MLILGTDIRPYERSLVTEVTCPKQYSILAASKIHHSPYRNTAGTSHIFFHTFSHTTFAHNFHIQFSDTFFHIFHTRFSHTFFTQINNSHMLMPPPHMSNSYTSMSPLHINAPSHISNSHTFPSFLMCSCAHLQLPKKVTEKPPVNHTCG